MSQLQWDDIQSKTRGHGVNAREKWKDIYRILFPDVADVRIPGPYFDVAEASKILKAAIDPQEYEKYFKQHLPKQILVKLNQEFNFIAEHTKRRLTEIVEEVCTETLKEYLTSKGLDVGPIEHPMDTPDAVQARAEFAGPGFVDPSLLDNLDVFSQHFSMDDTADLSYSFTWPDENTKDQADSTYGSNIVDGGSTASA
ncbi:hypothetical protein MMYC01_206228 [Madurella mycetomatis]|uniref:Uncharacterized protein n=1 Tax=Madurella mycetomatis TaxID=100816 RepID=A0A175W4A9_9PEZI|nr:hypothetical protein MMYC01_206228 [Madurella mycetomatis]